MYTKCILINDEDVRRIIEQQGSMLQAALFTKVKDMKIPGELSGFLVASNRLLSVNVNIFWDGNDQAQVKVFHITYVAIYSN